MDKSLYLEELAGNVILPVMMWDDFWCGTSNAKKLTGLNIQEYEHKLDEFAFAEERDYENFRGFLFVHRTLFEKTYASLISLTNEEIDYIFTRIGEERMKSADFH